MAQTRTAHHPAAPAAPQTPAATAATAATAAVQILAGPELGKRAAYVAEIRAALGALDGAPPEEHRLYSQDVGVAELLALLRNGSLFSSRRLVEYRGAEAIKTKDEVAVLADYIRAPAQDAVLLLVTESYGLEKPIEAAVGAAAKKTFFEMFDNEKPRWLRERLARDGLLADQDAIDALLELVENETGALDAACVALASVHPRGHRLGADDIEGSVARNRQEDAFSLFDRMAAGDLARALGVLDAVLADRKGDAVQIIAALIWSFRRLERVHLSMADGASFDEACLKQGLRSKPAQRRLRIALDRFPPETCALAIRSASDTDGALRSGLGTAFTATLLQLLVTSIMSGRPAVTGLPSINNLR